ncbi:NAD-dependent epimerase/dehydratase family protein [Candidatus Tisiphia endosymbiont of Ptychoptera albimana]|uniref:NAD-dependent epimerase/dehydratase family protein n=1 Tax=Candidatus Tisiphia endosymbiont of Ptychoptera albimana TaxID=3066260 RepID=UPI00312C85A6
MSNYLVTGGAGFIGSHLVDLLVKEGNQVVILDDLSTGNFNNSFNKNVEFVQGNILDQNILEKLFRNIDGCFHLAAIANVQESIDNWYHNHQVNLTGTINIFLQASKQNIPVVYASSAAVYGTVSDFPLQENGKVNPLSPYAADKLACELQAKVFGELKSLKTCGLRLFNVYGKGQLRGSDYSGVISIFKQKVEEGKELVVFGDGNQSRDFIHVSDVTNMCVRALSIASTSAPILNVCTGRTYSINELIQLINKIAIVKGVKYLPTQTGSINISVGSTELAQQLLNYMPVYELKTGLLELFSINL